ncbi:hypothetical protein [Aeromonas rivipollensis]|uniref:hypothetical protein n=1 Tax=Aeromonas rivipollensis TaxID=948519 RepID=UPI003D22595D
MKKSLLAMAVVLSSGMSLNAFAAEPATIVTGGTVYFNGEVVNAACAVSSDSLDQTVYLDQVRTARGLVAQFQNRTDFLQAPISLS